MAAEDWQVAQRTHQAMGTVMTHRAFGPGAEVGLDAACREVTRIESVLSCFQPASEIGRLNASAGRKGEHVSSETYELLVQARAFAARFPGCFDVTIGPLVALWRAARGSRSQPDAASLSRVLPLVDYRDLLLGPNAGTVALRRLGQSVDLGGIGKGLAGDRIRQVLKSSGVASAYANLGGNVVTLGAKPDGSPWQIGIQHPRQERSLVGAVAVVDETVVTSGDYQRYFIDRSGKRHHHILDPTTGYPAVSGLLSVSIITDTSLVADILSTALFVAGMEQGLVYLQCFPRAEAILIDTRLRVFITQGLRNRFRATEGVDVTVLN